MNHHWSRRDTLPSPSFSILGDCGKHEVILHQELIARPFTKRIECLKPNECQKDANGSIGWLFGSLVCYMLRGSPMDINLPKSSQIAHPLNQQKQWYKVLTTSQLQNDFPILYTFPKAGLSFCYIVEFSNQLKPTNVPQKKKVTPKKTKRELKRWLNTQAKNLPENPQIKQISQKSVPSNWHQEGTCFILQIHSWVVVVSNIFV